MPPHQPFVVMMTYGLFLLSTDVSCVCTSAQFQADAGACLVQHCTSSDLAAAVALQGAECAARTFIHPLRVVLGNSFFPSLIVSLSVTATASVTPKPVSFSLPSSATATSGTTTPTITTPTASTSPTTATTPAGTKTGTTPAAATTTAKSAASSLVANSGVGALVAIFAGFLAL